MDRAQKAARCLDILEKEFPGASIALIHKNPFELLIATMLSAQAADKLVNKVTETLFKKYKTPRDFAGAGLPDIEAAISPVNFFRNKAKHIKACSMKIMDEFHGKVPDTLEGLTSLAGVGRKTANIILGNAFGRDALAVDTHVKRVAQRLGLTASEDPDEIEVDLCAVIPQRRWTKTTHLFIQHGRKTCIARRPACGECPVNAYCDYYKKVYIKENNR